MFIVTEAWQKYHAGAKVGYMIVNHVQSPGQCDALEPMKRKLENELRAKFTDRRALIEHFPIPAYNEYYKSHKQNYHVLQQLESVSLKGKSIPRVAGLVEAMFMAELKNGLLTAGHDYEALAWPLSLDYATGKEQYVLMNGKAKITKAGDMMMADAEGIISSILAGPDWRTRIVPTTRKVLFIVYAPRGIAGDFVTAHLTDIFTYVRVVAPGAQIEQQGLLF